MTAEQVAKALDWSHSKVVRMEGTRVGLQSTDVGVLCDLYDAPAEHKAVMMQTAREAKCFTGRVYIDD